MRPRRPTSSASLCSTLCVRGDRGRPRPSWNARSGHRVLGYGSEILSGAGADYRGLEVDPEIVAHARERYGPVFETYDGSSIRAADGAFDLVVAFQVIAYLDDPVPWLREIRRVLDPDGTALITTPNRAYRLYDGQRPWNATTRVLGG